MTISDWLRQLVQDKLDEYIVSYQTVSISISFLQRAIAAKRLNVSRF